MWMFWYLAIPMSLAGVLDDHGYDMVQVEPGSFVMGSRDPPASVYSVGLGGVSPEPTKTDRRKYRPHRVTLTKPFAIGVTEVTRELWYAVQNAHKADGGTKLPPRLGNCRRPDCPLVGPDYRAVTAWLNRLSAMEGKRPYYLRPEPHGTHVHVDPTSDGYRLPTEAEWEYAARAGADTRYAGSDDWREVSAKGKDLHPVASLKPNSWGLHDMSGNAWEWTSDFMAPYPTEPVTDPSRSKKPIVAQRMSGQTQPVKVVRGGSVGIGPMGKYRQERLARVVYRGWELPHCNLTVGVGFRIVQNVPSGSASVVAAPTPTPAAEPATEPASAPAPPPTLRPIAGSPTVGDGVLDAGTLSASSTLSAQGANRYDPARVADRDLATAWVEGESDGGVGQSLRFTAPDRPCDRLVIWNGYQKSPASFAQNARVASAAVLINDAHAATLALADREGPQVFELATPAGAQVTLRIDAVNPGAKWQDTAISEVRQLCPAAP